MSDDAYQCYICLKNARGNADSHPLEWLARHLETKHGIDRESMTVEELLERMKGRKRFRR